MNRSATAYSTHYLSINCEQLYKDHNHTLIRNWAGTKYFRHVQHIKHNYTYGLMPKDGILPCFCKHEKAKDKSSYNNGKKYFHFLNLWVNAGHYRPMCENYERITN